MTPIAMNNDKFMGNNSLRSYGRGINRISKAITMYIYVYVCTIIIIQTNIHTH